MPTGAKVKRTRQSRLKDIYPCSFRTAAVFTSFRHSSLPYGFVGRKQVQSGIKKRGGERCVALQLAQRDRIVGGLEDDGGRK